MSDKSDIEWLKEKKSTCIGILSVMIPLLKYNNFANDKNRFPVNIDYTPKQLADKIMNELLLDRDIVNKFTENLDILKNSPSVKWVLNDQLVACPFCNENKENIAKKISVLYQAMAWITGLKEDEYKTYSRYDSYFTHLYYCALRAALYFSSNTTLFKAAYIMNEGLDVYQCLYSMYFIYL